MKYTVRFKGHYNSSGETDDYPTDFLYYNGEIEESDMINTENLPENPAGEGFCTLVWEYEIPDKDIELFEIALDDCPTVISWDYSKEEHEGQL